MAKDKGLPHNVQERLRHQNLQNILEEVASHIPKPLATKKETKTKKLRRVVLYMKYLLHKKEELETKIAVKNVMKCQDNDLKTDITLPVLKSPSVHKSKRKRAHIVFLSKFSDKSSNIQEGTTTENYKKCCYKENVLETQTLENTVDVIDLSCSKSALPSENRLELFHKKPDKSAADIVDKTICDLRVSSGYAGMWKKDFSILSKPFAEKMFYKNGSDCINKDKNFIENQNHSVSRNEVGFRELDGNKINLKQYVYEFSMDLEKTQKSSPDLNVFQSDQLGMSTTNIFRCEKETIFNTSHKIPDEYSLHCMETPQPFNELTALKSFCNRHQIKKEPLSSQTSVNSILRDTSTIKSVNNFEMPLSFNNTETQKNDLQCYKDIKMDKYQQSNHKMFSQRSISSSPEIFSSEESGAWASLSRFEKPYASNCSGKSRDDQLIQCDVKAKNNNFSVHQSFTDSSDNFSSDIFSSAGSGTFISSNEYAMSENDLILFEDTHIQSSDTSPNASFRPEFAMGEDNYEFYLPPQRNCDIFANPDLFSGMNQCIPQGSSDFSVNKILSKSCCQNDCPISQNFERCLDYNLYESSHKIPVFHNAAYNNVVDSRFINYFGINNYSQNLPLHPLPAFSTIGNYSTMNTKYSNIVPSDEIIDAYTPINAYESNQSMYAYEGMGNQLRLPIKQEDPERFLPSEELSYSLNYLTNAGYCYSQKDFNTL